VGKLCCLRLFSFQQGRDTKSGFFVVLYFSKRLFQQIGINFGQPKKI
jgi:hypothetical protein